MKNIIYKEIYRLIAIPWVSDLNKTYRKNKARHLWYIAFANLIALSPHISSAALSASTINTIQGQKPSLSFDKGLTIARDLSGLLSFNMPDESEGIITISPDITTIEAEPIYKFNQFVTKVIADGSENSISPDYYYDTDGDLAHESNSVLGTLTAKWSYKSSTGKTVTLLPSDLDLVLNACDAPYTLTISALNVKLQSRYGDPIENDYGSASQSYTINVKDYKSCFAKPNSMKTSPTIQWQGWNGSSFAWNKGSNDPTASGGNGGGYTSDFDPDHGFITSASTKFPHTGFPKAQFQLLMSNSQEAYTYKALEGGATSPNVSVDSLGNVILERKPEKTVTIRATPKLSNYPAVDYTFTLDTWAIPQSGTYTYAEAVTQCNGEANLLTRAELSSSPVNSAPMGWSWATNYYTRAIDGGVFGEWGYTNSNSYPGSTWTPDWYWTSDRHTKETKQFLVYSSHGYINYYALDTIHSAVCKG